MSFTVCGSLQRFTLISSWMLRYRAALWCILSYHPAYNCEIEESSLSHIKITILFQGEG